MSCKTMKLFDNERELRDYVCECDSLLDDEMERVIRAIESDGGIHLIGLTGPTCSGKTTAAKKITSYLEKRGFRLRVISIDDFYFDKNDLHKRSDKNPEIEIDYDSESTIDIELLAKQTENLLSCKETSIPKFDFKTGRRIGYEMVSPTKEDVYLFEGIQILYPRVNRILTMSNSYKSIYISPRSFLAVGELLFEPNEIRLLRRLVRDFRHRAAPPDFTFYLWKSVRENEERNIFPYVHLCDAEIDSTMPYEIGMLKPFLIPLLSAIQKEDAAYDKARNLLDKIADIPTVSHLYMTDKSLYREFI